MIERIKFTPYILVFIGLFFESILVFLLAPHHFVYWFNLFCVIQFLFSVFLFLKAKKKKNYFDFDMIFIVTFFFVMFFFPVFMYESDPTRFFAFQYEYNEDVISRATALSLLGIESYFLGSLTFRKKEHVDLKLSKGKIYHNIFALCFISALSLLLFILSGGYAKLAGAYSGEQVEASGMASYFWAFTPAFLFCALIFQFNNLYIIDKSKIQKKAINKLLLIYTIFFIGLIILTGSRTFPLQIVLICGSLYTILYKPISFVRFVPLLILGILALFIINIIRGGGDITGMADLVIDLVVCNRNTYVSVDYVDIHGITYGKSMLSVLLAPLPFFQTIVFYAFSINPWEAASSLIISKISLGEEGELGFGSNIIADLYMSFGMFGVIFFMFLLGRYIAKLLYYLKSNIYALVAYAVMMSYSVFIVRAEFFFFSRYLVWSLLIVFCVNIYNNSRKTNLDNDNNS